MLKVGFGYDIHQLKKSVVSTFISLAGIKIPSEYEIIAHSDGDVVLHAIVDALLGTISAGDIGDYFPPSNMKWNGRSSKHFVDFALNLVQKKGGVINNIDLSIITETPKISPFKKDMQESVAKILQISKEQVNIKATTNEKLDAIGTKKGIAVHTVCLINFPKL